MHIWPGTAKVATAVTIALATLSVTGVAVGAASVTPATARAAAVKPAAAVSSPWSQTGYDAALSRANLTEQTPDRRDGRQCRLSALGRVTAAACRRLLQ